METCVKSVEVQNLWGRFDASQTFEPGVNILYGKNGAGKTTLLHILANALSGDYDRFGFLFFRTVEVQLSDGTTICVVREEPSDESPVIRVTRNGECVYKEDVGTIEERDERTRRRMRERSRLSAHGEESSEAEPVLKTAYFPAFRSMIEAWASTREEAFYTRYRRRPGLSRQLRDTLFARTLFGDFVPLLNYPSPLDIEARLSDEVRQALIRVGRKDRELMSEAFLDVFKAIPSQQQQLLPERSDKILEEIGVLSERLHASEMQARLVATSDIYSQIRELLSPIRLSDEPERLGSRVLAVYRNVLRERVEAQQKAFEVIQRYLDSVNSFLEGKSLVVTGADGPRIRSLVRVEFEDGVKYPLRVLSSGERQITTQIYAATHMSEAKLVLIDEPEISLHVDWQQRLLRSMSEQLGERQIVACTHSPLIGADYPDRMVELRLAKSVEPTAAQILVDFDEEDSL